MDLRTSRPPCDPDVSGRSRHHEPAHRCCLRVIDSTAAGLGGRAGYGRLIRCRAGRPGVQRHTSETLGADNCEYDTHFEITDLLVRRSSGGWPWEESLPGASRQDLGVADMDECDRADPFLPNAVASTLETEHAVFIDTLPVRTTLRFPTSTWAPREGRPAVAAS